MRKLTQRQLVVIVALVLAFATVAVGVYGLVRGPGGGTGSAPSGDDVPRATPADAAEPAPVTLEDRALPHTTDPIVYARAVAAALFDWDTTSGLLPTDYTAVVLADADPSGEETPGLIRDVATYLPTLAQWLDLGSMEVTQSIAIGDVSVPDAWGAAVEQANGQLRPGTTAVTIDGTRRRSGVWNGQLAESSHPVSFTVFVACPPAFDRCRLLRLSELNNPLR